MSRGDTSTNVVLFFTVLIAAGLLVGWYMQTVRPTRYVIGTVTEDMQEIQQHLTNACASDYYNATYLVATQSGFYESNTTAFCIYASTFGSCKGLPCVDIVPVRVTLSQNTLLRVERNHTPVLLNLSK